MAKDNASRGARLWEKLCGQLDPVTAAALAEAEKPLPAPAKPPRTGQFAHQKLLGELTPEARDVLDGLVSEADTPQPDQGLARYILVEATDGEWPVTRLFLTPEAMVRYMGTKEGEDVVLIPLLGIQLEFTQGPQRYLKMPDGQTALTIPKFTGDPIRTVDAEMVFDNVERQLDNFMGPESLTIENRPKVKAPTKGLNAPSGPSDEDNDDEFDE